MNERDSAIYLELTSENWCKYFALCLCVKWHLPLHHFIIIAADKVLVSLEATVPVMTLHWYRLPGSLCRVTTLKHYGTVCGMCFVWQ